MTEGASQQLGDKSPLSLHLIMFFCAFLVSTSFTVGKAIATEMDPAVLTLLRFVLATAILGPYVAVRHGLRCSFSLVLRCSLISLSLVVFFWCMFLSLRYTSALNTSVIFTLVPSISGLYALFLVRERLRPAILVALFFGMAGAIWVISGGNPHMLESMVWNKGDLIFLAGCLVMGLYTPLIRLLHRGEPMVVMTFWTLVTGSIWLAFFAGGNLPQVAWREIPPLVWAGIGHLAFFTTVISFFLTQYSVPRIGPTRVMAYSYLYPSLVLLLDIGLGHGCPGVRVLPGVLVVLLAMVVLQRGGDGCSV